MLKFTHMQALLGDIKLFNNGSKPLFFIFKDYLQIYGSQHYSDHISGNR